MRLHEGGFVEKKVAWWDKLGKPQYGGEMVIRANWNIEKFDPYDANLGNIHSAWMERLISDDWTLDPEIFDYKPHWHPSRYLKGQLAESWEFTDPSTHVVHLRKGIHWQDIPPANGREFTADDVVFHFNRLYGLGGGFTKWSPTRTADILFQGLKSVTAPDKYTVVFKFSISNPEFIMETLYAVSPALCMENPEAVKKWGNLNDWHHAIGTGPFILKDFVSGHSATLIKNQKYWGYDERYPQDKLPYVDSVKYLIITDEAISLEAMRAGKIDINEHVSPIQARAMQKTNPEILQITHPDANAFNLEPRNDKAPFNDIRVRIAMQMAIDLPSIARLYYHSSVEPYPATLTSRYMKWWGFPYEEWPQDLRDEYAYNPTAAKKLLNDAGYPNGFKTNIVVDSSTDMDLLEIIKFYFSEVGIDMEIRSIDTASWNTFVRAENKHDQMTHRPGGTIGHCSSPTLDLTWFTKGGRGNGMVDDPIFNTFIPKAMATTEFDEIKKIMRDANEYAARQHFVIALLQPMAYSLCQPWLKGFNGQFGSAWSHVGGPGMLSFYLARFWIDHDLKKSMGY